MFWVWLINFTDIESLYERCTTRSNRCSFLDTHEMENDKFKSRKFLLKNEALNWNRSHAEINLFLLLFCKKKRNEMKRKSKLTIKVSEVDGFEHLDLIVLLFIVKWKRFCGAYLSLKFVASWSVVLFNIFRWERWFWGNFKSRGW